MSAIIARQADPTATATDAVTDEQLIAVWLRTKRSDNTRKAYTADVTRFRSYVPKPLARVSVDDLAAFQEHLSASHLAASSQARILRAVKSLLSFGARVRYLPFDVGKAIAVQSPKNRLAARILSEMDVLRMIDGELNRRNHALLRLLYATGGRVSEIVALTWADIQENPRGGQVTLYGKGGKTRVAVVSAVTYRELLDLRGEAADDAPVFVSRTGGGHLHPSQVHRIVRAAAERAGINGNVSPHWLRHSHASHALDRGANIAVVKDTLGHSSIAVTNAYLHAKPGDSSGLHLPV